METFNPRFLRSTPKEAAVIPFPRDETTPPVTNMNLAKIFTCFGRPVYPGSP